MWYWHIPHQYNEHCPSSPDPSESSVYAQRRLRQLVTTSLPLPTDSVSVVSARFSWVVSKLFTDMGGHGLRSPDSSDIGLKHVAAGFKIEAAVDGDGREISKTVTGLTVSVRSCSTSSWSLAMLRVLAPIGSMEWDGGGVITPAVTATHSQSFILVTAGISTVDTRRESVVGWHGDTLAALATCFLVFHAALRAESLCTCRADSLRTIGAVVHGGSTIFCSGSPVGCMKPWKFQVGYSEIGCEVRQF